MASAPDLIHHIVTFTDGRVGHPDAGAFEVEFPLARATMLEDIAEAQYPDLLSIYEINLTVGTARDVTEDVAAELAKTYDYDELPQEARDLCARFLLNLDHAPIDHAYAMLAHSKSEANWARRAGE